MRMDRSRSKKFFIDRAEASTKLVKYCLRHFERGDAMCQDQINHHHLRALFMIHCVQSQSTPELLNELAHIDLYTQLSFWDSEENVIGAYEHDYKRVLALLSWLYTQHHASPSTGIIQNHLAAIDAWLRQVLASYPNQFNLEQILVAGTYTRFRVFSDETLAITLTNEKATRRRHDPLQIYTPKPESSPFYEILCRFLRDNSRAGSYYIDGYKYAVFSVFVAVFLLHNPMKRLHERLELKFAEEILRFTIPKSDVSRVLSKVLRSGVNAESLQEGCRTVILSHLEEADPPPRHELSLAIAYGKFKDEIELPSQAYTLWISQHHDCEDHVEQGYDFCIL